MSLSLTLNSDLRSQASLQRGNLAVSQFFCLALLLTLAAVAADQFLAAELHSSSPLWAAAALLALVWRKDAAGVVGASLNKRLGFSFVRMALFIGAHVLLVSAAYVLLSSIETSAGAVSFAGWIAAALKLSVLLPTLLLAPLREWRIFTRDYAAEGIAAALVLLTFFPGRILLAVWPWYGQVLGKFVFYFAGFFAPGLAYTSAFTPTIHGPGLDVTILYACSGISGIDLFDYLFALVVFLDWNRLRKGRTLIAYFLGVAAMFAANALRISSLVILGNRGFADVVARFHLSAGWIFFSMMFLTYLSLIYRKILVGRPKTSARSARSNGRDVTTCFPCC